MILVSVQSRAESDIVNNSLINAQGKLVRRLLTTVAVLRLSEEDNK